MRWRLGRHPQARDTVITRISRWRLRDIILGYAAAIAGLTALGALALQRWGGGRPTYATAFRDMAQALMSPGELLGQDDRPAPYYAIALMASAIAYIAPVFLLGSFVLKLFVLDPIVWKQSVTVEDRIGCGAVLVFRFYNASRHTLIGAAVTVTAEVSSPSDPTSVRSRAMAVVTHDTERAEARTWASVLPYEPYSNFVPHAGPRGAPLGSANVAASPVIDLQGLVVPQGLRHLQREGRGNRQRDRDLLRQLHHLPGHGHRERGVPADHVEARRRPPTAGRRLEELRGPRRPAAVRSTTTSWTLPCSNTSSAAASPSAPRRARRRPKDGSGAGSPPAPTPGSCPVAPSPRPG